MATTAAGGTNARSRARSSARLDTRPMSRPLPEPPALTAWPVTDAEAWDAFVVTAAHRAFPQLWAWGELRAGAGWQPLRIAVGTPGERPRAGVQLLLRRVPLGGWALAYAPRGPIGDLDDAAVREALVSGLRSVAGSERIGRMRADPEAAAGEPFGASLLAPPWRAAPIIQPPTTRLLDLGATEDELWSALARKHRQYVSKAGREGVIVTQLDA
ncbi:MAG: peptidoglycan bridge formation glycyltransferase FemA/FemB family protein, partial [Chloroflexi bacterium]